MNAPPPEEPTATTAAQPVVQGLAIEDLLSAILRFGVYACVGLVGLGTTLSFLNHPEYLSSGEELSRVLTAPAPRTFQEILESARTAQGRGFVMLGILVMIATPVFRVAMSMIAFRQQKDRIYTWISATVLALLLLSLVLGQSHG
ncbi:MAG: DUF1634 domain-containing protein [Myxococcota bacterium]|nr:DUF1634 domain-containing protein [Myxococcota bacterium]